MPKLRRISIKNFRSIAALEMEATDLTVIVGDNDCGKSNVLRALNLFFNDETNPGSDFNFSTDYNRYAEARVKRAAEIQVEVDLELPWSYRENNGDFIRWRKRWRADGLVEDDNYWGIRLEARKRGSGFIEHVVPIEGRSRVPALLARMQFEYVPAVRSAEYFRALRGRIYQVIANASEEVVRRSSTEFERVITSAVADLLGDIGSELNDQSRLSLPNDLTSIFESLDFLAGEQAISLDNRGDGIKARYIPLILKFIAEKARETSGVSPTFIWAYEEPENNLEFRRAQALADAFRKLAQDELSQVLLTTHSPIFYNMHVAASEESDDGAINICSAYHLTKESTDEGTQARSAHEASVSLDERMGAMAIIAPHIRAAQEALAEAAAQAEDLQAKLNQFNQDNLPTLFVEGATDYIIFRTLLAHFRPQQAQQIFLAEPPIRAGANYVTNMLRSWEYRTRHLPVVDRRKAVGIVDGDAEGAGAAERFDGETVNWRHVAVVKLGPPPHLVEAAGLGLSIPATLEEYWPRQVWDHAESKGWLVDRPKAGTLSEGLVDRLADENLRLGDLLNDDWRIYYERCVNGDIDAHVKTAWSAYIVKRPVAQLEPMAGPLLTVLDDALGRLGIT